MVENGHEPIAPAALRKVGSKFGIEPVDEFGAVKLRRVFEVIIVVEAHTVANKVQGFAYQVAGELDARVDKLSVISLLRGEEFLGGRHLYAVKISFEIGFIWNCVNDDPMIAVIRHVIDYQSDMAIINGVRRLFLRHQQELAVNAPSVAEGKISIAHLGIRDGWDCLVGSITVSPVLSDSKDCHSGHKEDGEQHYVTRFPLHCNYIRCCVTTKSVSQR